MVEQNRRKFSELNENWLSGLPITISKIENGESFL